MRLFSNLFSKKRNQSEKLTEIIAPLSGTIIEIEKVPDPVFSDKIVGDGIAIDPSGHTMVSPVDGIIGKIFNTLHAFSIQSHNGIELFVHFGIDTVQLKGIGFQKVAKEKQLVKKGDIIITFDLNLLKKTAKSILTPVVISNTEKIKQLKKKSGQVIAGQTPIMIVNI